MLRTLCNQSVFSDDDDGRRLLLVRSTIQLEQLLTWNQMIERQWLNSQLTNDKEVGGTLAVFFIIESFQFMTHMVIFRNAKRIPGTNFNPNDNEIEGNLARYNRSCAVSTFGSMHMAFSIFLTSHTTCGTTIKYRNNPPTNQSCTHGETSLL